MKKITLAIFFMVISWPLSVAGLSSPFGDNGMDFFDLLNVILDEILVPLGTVVVVMAIIYSGFLYVTAQGNDEQLKKAHQAIAWTAVGTVILLGATVLSHIIENTMELITDE